MDLRRLEQLVALAEEGSFVRAAERTHLSQPALSRGIQNLEQELGVQLFDRARQGVVPTPAGRRLLDRARRVLFEARGLHRDADLLRHGQLGEVYFVAGSYPSSILLPDVLATLMAEYPDMNIKAEVNDWGTLLRKMTNEEMDFAVLARRAVPPEAQLETRRLWVETAGWYARTDHPLAGRSPLTARELLSYPLASVPLPSGARADLQRNLGLAPGEKLALGIESNDLSALRQVMLRSDVVLRATATLCRHEVAVGRAVRLDVKDSGQKVEFVVVRPAHRTLTPAARKTIALIEQLAARR